MKTALELLDHEGCCTGCQWCHVIRTFPGLLELVAQRAREEMRAAAAEVADSHHLAGTADAIRALPVTP